MSTLNVLDLFCGAGGLSYGFESAGFNVLLGIDSDAKALETFELNHKGAKALCGDITQIEYEKDIKPLLGENRIDVIIGGPPCQGMSLSGPRKFDDPRNKLYLSYIRLVKEIQPKAFVIENVPVAKVSLNSTDPVLLEKGRYRRFTPREVARIQSFPETFELIGSESAQYRALGNAIPPVMFWYVAHAVSEQFPREI